MGVLAARRTRPKATPAARYRARPGSHINDDDAEIIGRCLDRLRATGQVTPARMVDDGRSKKSEMHHFFEWDDKKTGELWRREQARHLIRAVVVVYEESDGEVKSEGWVSVRVSEPGTDDAEDETDVKGTTDARAYVPVTDAMQDPGMRDQVLEEARRWLEHWKEKFGHLQELAAAAMMVEGAISKIRRGRRSRKR